MMNEEEIINGCIKENRQAQEALYKKYASRMMAVCYRYAKDMLEAEDILQEGFIKVFDNISNYSGKGTFEGWIRKIMINVALNKVRARGKYVSFVEDTDLDMYEEQTPVEKVQYKQLLEALEKMPEGYRVVFNLFAVEGYTHQEIAKELNITHSTARSQYAKAKNYLKKLITQLEKVNL